MSPNRRLFLIDGYSQVYRAYHGIRGLTGPDGQSTNAVFGFITMLRKLIDDEQPELIAAAFDLRGPTFREMADERTGCRCRTLVRSRARGLHGARRAGRRDSRRRDGDTGQALTPAD